MKRRKTLAATLLLAAFLCLGMAGCGSSSLEEGSYVENVDVVANEAVADAGQPAQGEQAASEQVIEQQAIEQKTEDQNAEEQKSEGEPAGDGLSGYTVTIDAGHQAWGNSDTEPIGPGAYEEKAKVSSGTSGVATGNEESEINLAVALKLRDYLASRGVNVVMVRESQDVDIANSQRAMIANESGSALFVRLHCDGADDSSRTGFWTLVPGYNEWTGPIVDQSRVAGEIVQRNAVAATGAVDLGITERTDLSGFNWCTVPTILCEMGYMSNPDEDVLLGTEEYQQKLAQGIGDGVIEYLGTLG